MTGSTESKQLSAAVFKARFEIIPPAKDGVNKFLGNKYQTLNAIESAVRMPEYNNGLLRTFHLDSHARTDGVDPILTMYIEHVPSGEWKSWGMPLPKTMILGTVKNDNEREVNIGPQQQGIAITYNKRYMTKSFWCIPDDDDDAEGAYQRGEGAERRKPEPTANAAADKPAKSQAASSNLTIDMIIMDLGKCEDEKGVQNLVKKHNKFISMQHRDSKTKFREAYDLKMAEFQHDKEGAN